MREGRNLQDLAAEIQRRAAAKADYIVPSQHVAAFRSVSDTPMISISGLSDSFGLTDNFHSQLAEKTKIPKPYYDRLIAEGSDLWQSNVNHWLARSDKRRMVRTLDGNARALLSDQYQRVDNEHVAEVALDALLGQPDIRIASAEITDKRLYIKALFPNRQAEVKRGDIVEAGVIIGNSEIGDSSLYVYPLINRLICLNGAIFNESKWRRMHVGSRMELPEGVILAEDTMRADDSAILLKMRDMIKAAAGEVFDRLVEKMRAAAESRPVAHPVAAVEVLARQVGLLHSERDNVLERLIRGQDYSAYGMGNAITNLANTTESYDRATELERIGAEVMVLPASDWRLVAEADRKAA